MAAKSPIETKLDRNHDRVNTYFEELRKRILEIFDFNVTMTSEIKEFRKEFTKLREHVLQISAEVEALRRLQENRIALPMAAGAEESSGEPLPPPTETVAEAEAAPAEPPAPSGPKSLKEYFASNSSIYSVTVLNAFIKATREVFKILTEKEARFLRPSVLENKPVPMVIAGQMKLDRDKGMGSMVIGMSKACAIQLTRDVLRMPEGEQLKAEYLRDVASEVCNQVCGSASVALKADGYAFRMSMPEVKSGNASDLNREYGIPQIVLHFEYHGAPFFILLWG